MVGGFKNSSYICNVNKTKYNIINNSNYGRKMVQIRF